MRLGIPRQGESGFPGKRGGARLASRDIEHPGSFMEEFGCFSGRACFGSRCLGFLGHDNICGGISLTAQAGEIALFGIWGVGLSLGMFVAFPKCGKALCHEALSVTRAGECAVGGDADRCSDMRSCGDAAGFVGRCGNVSWGLQSRETCGFFACGWSAMGPDALAMHGSSTSQEEGATTCGPR